MVNPIFIYEVIFKMKDSSSYILSMNEKFKLKKKLRRQKKERKKIQLVVDMRFGTPGCGKTTDAARQTIKFLKTGLPVFSNVELAIPGVYQLEVSDLGRYFIPEGLVIIDEASLSGIDNRSWKSLSKELMEFFFVLFFVFLIFFST